MAKVIRPRKKAATPKAGPHVTTARARKTPGRSVRVGGTVVIKKKGRKPIAFRKGGLHATLGVPQGQKIPASKMAAAKAGRYGPKAKKQALFAANVLAKGRRTAIRGRK